MVHDLINLYTKKYTYLRFFFNTEDLKNKKIPAGLNILGHLQCVFEDPLIVIDYIFTSEILLINNVNNQI